MAKQRWLIACEYSGRVRDAIIALGHEALSCDLEPSETVGPHYQGDVLEILDAGWDGRIAHPPCTYFTVSGSRWLFEDCTKTTKEERWELLEQSRKFFLKLWNCNIPKIAIENPTPHKHAQLPPYTQAIQPWWFGDKASKRTCLWLKNLYPLEKTSDLEPPKPLTKEWQIIHYEPPGPNQSKNRSRTFLGVASAMASQWLITSP